ncbi:MAG TPA: hypothetical protein VHI50_06960 [Micromonosporaceae bacterium]|jgi:hypothetical protein|nr:hypothetical protein [Micromonosporaceae bacterium]
MAIATTIENAVLAQAQAVAETAGLDTTYNPGTATEIIPFLVDARKALRDMGAPETGLVAALSTSAYAALLKAVAGASYDQGLGSVASARIVQGRRSVHSGDEPARGGRGDPVPQDAIPMNANVEDTQKNFVVRVVARPTPLAASTPDGLWRTTTSCRLGREVPVGCNHRCP